MYACLTAATTGLAHWFRPAAVLAVTHVELGENHHGSCITLAEGTYAVREDPGQVLTLLLHAQEEERATPSSPDSLMEAVARDLHEIDQRLNRLEQAILQLLQRQVTPVATNLQFYRDDPKEAR